MLLLPLFTMTRLLNRTISDETISSMDSGTFLYLAFFAKFPKFNYNPTLPVTDEFNRLARARRWTKESKAWKKNWKLCMGAQYDHLIGTRINDLNTWKHMCHKLKIPGEFTSITKCRKVSLSQSLTEAAEQANFIACIDLKALAKVYVNIVDLMECWNTEESPKRFPSRAALAKYTKEENLYFSRDVAKEDKVLRTLLKHIL